MQSRALTLVCLSVFFLLFVFGCAKTPPPPPPEPTPTPAPTPKPEPDRTELMEFLRKRANIPLYCHGAGDCEVKWGRALGWVLDNSSWKIRHESYQLITTEGLPDDPRLSYRAHKVHLGEGRYRILLRVGCGYGDCLFKTLLAQAGFVDAVLNHFPPRPAIMMSSTPSPSPKIMRKPMTAFPGGGMLGEPPEVEDICEYLMRGCPTGYYLETDRYGCRCRQSGFRF